MDSSLAIILPTAFVVELLLDFALSQGLRQACRDAQVETTGATPHKRYSHDLSGTRLFWLYGSCDLNSLQ
jgi:hypothetical protein